MCPTPGENMSERNLVTQFNTGFNVLICRPIKTSLELDRNVV